MLDTVDSLQVWDFVIYIVHFLHNVFLGRLEMFFN